SRVLPDRPLRDPEDLAGDAGGAEDRDRGALVPGRRLRSGRARLGLPEAPALSDRDLAPRGRHRARNARMAAITSACCVRRKLLWLPLPSSTIVTSISSRRRRSIV